MIAAGRRGQRPSGQEQQDQRDVLDGASDPSIALPPPRGRERRNVSVFEPPSPAKAANEVHIFHQRQLHVTPELPENIPPREQGLVSVSEVEQPHPEPDATLDPSRPPRPRVEREAKAAANDRGMTVETPEQVEPAGPEPRVSVQEHEPAAPGALRAGVHLAAT